MKRFAIAVLIGSLCVAIAGPTQAKDSNDVIVVNTEPIPVIVENQVPVTVQNQVPVIVQNGDIFNYWANHSQHDERFTMFTVPQGKRLIVTDIDVNPVWGPDSFPNERGRFSLEGPMYQTKVRFNVTYPTPVHVSYTTGLVFEEGLDVVIFISVDVENNYTQRQYDVTIAGRLVSK